MTEELRTSDLPSGFGRGNTPESQSAAPNLPGQDANLPSLPAGYDLFEVLRGGMSFVVKARNVSTGATVILKTAKPPHSSVDLLRREYQTHMRLLHPRVVRVLDLVKQDGTHSVDEGIWVVMEFVGGGSLDAWCGNLMMVHINSVTRQTLEALIYLHSESILHRDLKPHNILTEFSNGRIEVKISDFGLSKWCQDGEMTFETRGMRGTRAYAPPEVHQRNTHAKQGDVYSWACCIAHLATGLRPQNHRTPPPDGDLSPYSLADLLDVGARLPQPFAELLMRCFEQNYTRRPMPQQLLDELFGDAPQPAAAAAPQPQQPTQAAEPHSQHAAPVEVPPVPSASEQPMQEQQSPVKYAVTNRSHRRSCTVWRGNLAIADSLSACDAPSRNVPHGTERAPDRAFHI